ncbi:MAG: antitoxin [Burkholderiales bacterium]|nr:antitoxin [Burkholderiales bacterium]
MRTTIDLPSDLHDAISSIAAQNRRSLSRTVADLIRRGLAVPGGGDADSAGQLRISPPTGLPLVRSARPVSAEDVRALEDE